MKGLYFFFIFKILIRFETCGIILISNILSHDCVSGTLLANLMLKFTKSFLLTHRKCANLKITLIEYSFSGPPTRSTNSRKNLPSFRHRSRYFDRAIINSS